MLTPNPRHNICAFFAVPTREQILKYGGANVLFLAMTICVPLVRRTE